MPHPPEAFPLFIWLAALLVPSMVGGCTAHMEFRIPDSVNISGKRTFRGRAVYTMQLLNVTSPSGPDLRFTRQCRAISLFRSRTVARAPKGSQRSDSSVSRSTMICQPVDHDIMTARHKYGHMESPTHLASRNIMLSKSLPDGRKRKKESWGQTL